MKLICEECGKSGQYVAEYELPGDDVMTITLCMSHATQAGFCTGCGYFVAGIDSEIPSMKDLGICSECLDELRAETGEYDQDEGGIPW